ncbi:MAG: ATP-dependent RNA helicase RhlB [Gammaproteobacteria bacterium]|jgi:ATP-dependent RNA helicase RhlB
MSQEHLTSIEFANFDLPQEVVQGIEEAGFLVCTPIQEQTLPLTLQGRDVAGQAQTGTGKTAAFLIATFNHLLRNPPAQQRTATQVRALILAPTRELAIQIHRDATKLGAHTGFRIGIAYGGTDYDSQRKKLAEGVDVLIGTPGRIIDYFKQRVFDLRRAQVVVLDEADRMFDLGFIKDVRFLLRRCPPPQERLGLLFSATMSLRVNELAYEHMNNPQLIRVEPEQVTAERVRQVLYHTSNEEKIPLLLGLMKSIDARRSIVFVNTKRDAEKVWAYLEGNGYSTAILSGDVPQRKRQSLLRRFQEGELAILVATDVAARGLHIPDVSHVFNYDLPQDAEDYVHRIGRTARLGADGDAISFACERFVYSLPDIESFIGHAIPVEQVTDDLLVEPAPPVPRPRRKSPPGQQRRKGGKGTAGRSKRRGKRERPAS